MKGGARHEIFVPVPIFSAIIEVNIFATLRDVGEVFGPVRAKIFEPATSYALLRL